MAWSVTGGVAGTVASISGPIGQTLGYAANSFLPVTLPTPLELWTMYLRGTITELVLRTFLACHGIDYRITGDVAKRLYTPDADGVLGLNQNYENLRTNVPTRALLNSRVSPSIDDTLLMYRRKLISDDVANRWLSISNDGDTDIAAVYKKLQYEIPGSSDLIRFAVRESFDPGTVAKYGYHKEFPRQILPWMESQGYGENIGIPRPVNATDNLGKPMVGNATWSDLYWYAHWELPSLGQGYEMTHRLYAQSRYGPSPDIIGGNNFEKADLQDLQKNQDIPEYWRSRLEAISYHPLTRVDAKRMYESNHIDEARVYHNMRAGGYDDANADAITKWFQVEKKKKANAAVKKTASEYICEHYTIGTLSYAQADAMLDAAMYDAVEKKLFFDKCNLKIHTSTIKSGLSAIKTVYIGGGLDTVGLNAELTRLGVDAAMRSEYDIRWTLLRNFKFKTLTVKNLAEAYANGVISENEFLVSLTNLGYDDTDKYRLVMTSKVKRTLAQYNQLQTQLNAVKSAIKEAQQNAAKIAKTNTAAQKAAQKVQDNINKKRLRGLISAASDANIKKWYDEGLVKIDEIAFRYLLRDFSIVDTKRMLFGLDENLTQGEIDAATQKAVKVFIKLGYPIPLA